MSKEIVIEQASLADLDAILEIENLSFDMDQFTRKQFVYLINKAKGIFYVVRSGGKIVAYISLLSHARTKYLRVYSIAVHPEARGQKLGQLLIDQSIGYLTNNQLKAILLEVKVSNTAAINLYEKNGFVKTGIIRNYYHDGSDAYQMRRD